MMVSAPPGQSCRRCAALITPGARQVYSFNTRVEPDAPEIMGKLTPLLK